MSWTTSSFGPERRFTSSFKRSLAGSWSTIGRHVPLSSVRPGRSKFLALGLASPTSSRGRLFSNPGQRVTSRYCGPASIGGPRPALTGRSGAAWLRGGARAGRRPGIPSLSNPSGLAAAALEPGNALSRVDHLRLAGRTLYNCRHPLDAGHADRFALIRRANVRSAAAKRTYAGERQDDEQRSEPGRNGGTDPNLRKPPVHRLDSGREQPLSEFRLPFGVGFRAVSQEHRDDLGVGGFWFRMTHSHSQYARGPAFPTWRVRSVRRGA